METKKGILVVYAVLFGFATSCYGKDLERSAYKNLKKQLNLAIKNNDQVQANTILKDAQTRWEKDSPKRFARIKEIYDQAFEVVQDKEVEIQEEDNDDDEDKEEYEEEDEDEVADNEQEEQIKQKNIEIEQLKKQISELKRELKKKNKKREDTQTLVEENLKLRSQLKITQLNSLRPQVKALRESAQKAKTLESQINNLKSKLEKAAKIERQAQTCTQRLNRLKVETKDVEKNRRQSEEQKKRVSILEEQVKKSHEESLRAQEYNKQLESLKVEFDKSRAGASSEISNLQKAINSLKQQLTEAQNQARLAKVCDQELKAAQSALEGTIKELQGILTA